MELSRTDRLIIELSIAGCVFLISLIIVIGIFVITIKEDRLEKKENEVTKGTLGSQNQLKNNSLGVKNGAYVIGHHESTSTFVGKSRLFPTGKVNFGYRSTKC